MREAAQGAGQASNSQHQPQPQGLRPQTISSACEASPSSPGLLCGSPGFAAGGRPRRLLPRNLGRGCWVLRHGTLRVVQFLLRPYGRLHRRREETLSGLGCPRQQARRDAAGWRRRSGTRLGRNACLARSTRPPAVPAATAPNPRTRGSTGRHPWRPFLVLSRRTPRFAPPFPGAAPPGMPQHGFSSGPMPHFAAPTTPAGTFLHPRALSRTRTEVQHRTEPTPRGPLARLACCQWCGTGQVGALRVCHW